MKLLSFAVPCFNSAAYMEKCVDSLLKGGEDVEIIIVNDGSTDETAEIAERYVSEHPSIVKAVHKENGGHGSAVNAGIDQASGLYFKVVDSDDWVKERRHKVMRYKHTLPIDEMFTWEDVRHFHKGQYLLMHSVIFRTKLLRECGLRLPEHTFYVDNLYVFEPLPYVRNMYYLDVNFYRYYIGREDQSVNESVMIGRIDQQIRVNKLMVDYMAEKKNQILSNKKLYTYMLSYLDIITTVSSILLIRSGTEENLEKKKELWNYLKKKDWLLYRKLRYGLLGNCTNLPGRSGRMISVEGYKICRHFFNFN